MVNPAVPITRDQVLKAIYCYVRWDEVGPFGTFKRCLAENQLSAMELSCARIYAVAALDLVEGSNEFRARAIGKTSWAHRNHVERATPWEIATANRITTRLRTMADEGLLTHA